MTLDLRQASAFKEKLFREKIAREQGLRRKREWIDYEDLPVDFVLEGLREELWSKQKEILEALRDYDRIAVKACHESSKSFTAARAICWWIACHKPGDAFVVTSAPTFIQVRSILWREVNRAHKGRLPGHTNQTEWWLNGEMVALGRKPEDADADAFQGLHALNMLVVFDEACGMSQALWTAAETLIANEGGKFLVIGNPDDPNTEFGRICKPGSGWKVITISAFDTPNFTDEKVSDDLHKRLISSRWVEERKKRWGESNPLYISKVLGEFPDVSEDSLIPPRLVTEAVNRELPPEGANELGVDVARFGRNESVIYHRKGPVGRLWKAMNKRDTMEVSGYVIQAVLETGATRVKIDDIGVGGGVVDRLNEVAKERDGPLRNVIIVPVNVGRPASEVIVERIGSRIIRAKDRFANLKAEITWQLRDRFFEGDIDIDNDEDTQAQIVEIRYEVTSRGLFKIESKDDVEQRLVKMQGATGESGSPDRFDAMVLAFAEVDARFELTQIHPDVLLKARMANMRRRRF